MTENKKICSRCVCDDSIPEIRFDANGICQFCHIHDFMETQYPQGMEGEKRLGSLLERIKRDGRRREHDCVVGVSGGRDSTYLMHMAVKYGLRPLAVHFDNGWNSEIAVSNIKKATEKLGVPLYTHVADWEQFRNLQISFLKASVSDADIPTDVAIFGTLHQAAAREGVKYILNGHSFRTEGVMPKTWTYMDGRYIKSVHRRFGKLPLSTVPNFTIFDLLRYTIAGGIKTIPFLNYFPYKRSEVDQIIKEELGWVYYGGHHHESHYTHFFQSYYLPKKFNIDKRKIECSALIRSGQMSRDAALAEINSHPYKFDEELVAYVISKFGLSQEEFNAIMNSPRKSFHDYPTYYPWMKLMAQPVRILCEMGILPELLYQKYLA
ncbi:MAG: N-acetyl sugar amidotransferase [Lentisphaerae bacterium GWF2_52_8]|nr:MAG: N-acetyl sugar amidotransferase [Lentisphaerae bacterium GWF2_52_8]